MANPFFKFMYIFSGISPIFFVLSAEFLIKKKWGYCFIWFLTGILICCIFSCLFSYGKKNCEDIIIKISKVSLADNLIPSYLLSCLSSFFTFIDDTLDNHIYILFSFSIILIISSLNSATPNPVLAIKRYITFIM